MKRVSKCAGLALAAALVFTPRVRAESSTGTLFGTITAPDGSRLPGVILTFTRP